MTRTVVSLFMLGALLFSGCDSARLKDFSSLAAAGSAYSAAFPAFSTQLGTAVITINNDQAVSAHANSIDPDTAKTQILQQDTDLKIYLSTLDRLNAQVEVLKAYFNAMGELANSKSSDQIVTSANGLVEQLSNVNNALGKSKISSLPAAKTIEELAGPPIQLLVAHFQVAALDKNLDKHAQVVDRALALQEAAIKAMTLQLSLALQGDDQFRERTQVVTPYLLKELPKSWSADRAAYIRSSVSLESADSAQKAVTKLRATFQDVVSNKDAQVDLNGLLDDIGAMAGYAHTVKAALTPTK